MGKTGQLKVTPLDDIAKVHLGQASAEDFVKDFTLQMSVPFIPTAIGATMTIGEAPDINTKELADAIAADLEEQVASVLPEVASLLHAALTSALMSPVWDWKDGARDIYDTGALAASGSVTVSGSSLQINYSAPYADIVHNGGYIFPYGNKSARPIYLPGRPWVDAVMNGTGPVPMFDVQKAIFDRLG